MNITRGSYATPVMIRLALDGRDKYLNRAQLYQNYLYPPKSVMFWLVCKEVGKSKKTEIPWDESKSTDDEIYFLFPSDMLTEITRYRCTFKLKIDKIIDHSIRYFLVNITPEPDQDIV